MTIQLTKSKQVEHYLDWLRDAHAMEQQAETMLSAMASRLEHYPSLKARIEQHINETRLQQQLLKNILTHHDIDTSTIKDLAGKTTAWLQGLGGVFASDEVVKGAISGYVFEQFEIACYQALIASAEQIGATQDKIVFEQILTEEKAMAQWLSNHLAEITQQFLIRTDIPELEAKK